MRSISLYPLYLTINNLLCAVNLDLSCFWIQEPPSVPEAVACAVGV